MEASSRRRLARKIGTQPPRSLHCVQIWSCWVTGAAGIVTGLFTRTSVVQRFENLRKVAAQTICVGLP